MQSTATPAIRSTGADFLKFIASILVVGIHVTPEYQGGSLTGDAAIGGLLIQSLVRLGLPVFFVVSGYFLLNKTIPAYLPFYRSRIPKLVIPFLLYAALYVVYNIATANNPSPWFAQFSEIVYAPTLISGHFWFVGSMLGIYLLAPFFSAMLGALSDSASIKGGFCLLGVVVFQTFWPTVSRAVGAASPIAIPHIDMWLLYFLLGGVMGRIDGRRFLKLAATICALGYVLTVAFYYLRQNKLYDFFPHDAGINMALLATSATYLLIAAGNAIKSTGAQSVVQFGSKHSFGVYLVHLLVMQILGKMGFFDWMLWINFYMVILSTLTIYVMSLMVAFVMDTLIVNPVMGCLSPAPSRLPRHQG